MSAEDDGERTNPLIRNMPATNVYEVDVDALALSATGWSSLSGPARRRMAARGARRSRSRLGLSVTEFPGHHAGFLGDEHGQQGEPSARGCARCSGLPDPLASPPCRSSVVTDSTATLPARSRPSTASSWCRSRS